MIRFAIYRYFFGSGVLCALVFLLGCLSTQTSRKTRTTEDDTGIAPQVSPKEDIPSPDVRYTFLDTVNRGNELVLTDEDFDKDEKTSLDVSNASNAGVTPRFRVQVFASNKIETVREQKKKLEKMIKEQVVIGYEAPYYKLYAGNFEKRDEARRILPRLKKLGYLDAWVVSTNFVPEN